MEQNRYNPEVAKRLYDQASAIGTSKLSKDDFFGKLNEDGYAEKIYDRFKSKYGVSLLDAPDAKSLRDSLYSQPATTGGLSKEDEDVLKELDNKVEAPTPKQRKTDFFGVNVPNIDDSLSVEIPQVAPVAPKVPDMELKMSEKQEGLPNPFHKPERMSDIVGESLSDRIQKQINILGESAVMDAARADALYTDVETKLAQMKNQYGDFINEYNRRSTKQASDDRLVYTEHWVPWGLGTKQSKEDRDWINANSAKYDRIQRDIRAIERQKELISTYKQLATVDRSIAQGEVLSSMVSDGDIPQETMDILRSGANQAIKDDHVRRMVADGKIDTDTANKISSMGDLTNNASMIQGLFKTGSVKDIATLGMNEILRNFDIVNIANKLQDGIPVTEDERNVFTLYSKLSQMQNKDRGFWFGFGQMMQQSLLFGVEAALTGGLGTAGKQLGKTGIKALIEEAGEQGMKKVLGKVAKNSLDVVKKSAIKQAKLTPLTFSTYANFSDRIAGQTMNAFNEGKELSFGDYAKQLYLSYAETFAERFSESFGNVIENVPMWTIISKGKATRELNNAFLRTLSRIADSKGYKATSTFLEDIGVQSAPVEMMSELSGTLTNYLLQIPVEGFDNEALNEITPEFFLQVGLQSLMMGGMGTLSKYAVGAMASAVEEKKAQNEFDKAVKRTELVNFSDETLNGLKTELLDAMQNGNYIETPKGLSTRPVGSILSDINNLVEQNGNTPQDRFALSLLDNAVRHGAYRYGQMQAIKSYVESKIGEFENEDGNVYEVTDPQGNAYYMLDSTDDAVILIDRNTGEKSVKRKDFFSEGSIKQTNGNDFALQTFILNIDKWNAENVQMGGNGELNVEQPQAKPAFIRIYDQFVPIRGYDEETGEYIVWTFEGDEVRVNPNDPGVSLVYEGAQELQNEQNTDDTTQVEGTGEQNDVDNTDTGSDIESQGDQTEQVEQMEYDEEGNPVWLSASAERGKQEIDSAFEGDEAKAFVADKVKEAEKALKKLENKKPKSTNIRDRKLEIEKIKADKEQAKANLEYWNSMNKLYNAPVEEIVEPVAEPVAIQKTTSDSVLAEGVQPYTVGENIKKRYEEAPKVYGAEDTYTDADGNTYKGRWVVVEADDVTASHDPNTLQTSEGFPLTDKGRNVNDNDYSTKRGVIETMASNYDSRALDEPVIVSEGAIVSGNNRTISGQIAAQNGTDAKYKEALPAKSAMRGIPSEELSKFKNPRLVFELAEPIEYTTENFARFNRARNKTKSPVDMAIAIGKQDTSRLVGQIMSTIGEVEKLGELYQNQNTVATIMKQIVESGIINQNELPQFYTQEYGITDAGKDFIETLLIGSVINEDQIRILNSEGMKQYREKIVSAMLPIANNMKYEDNIGKHLNTAIKYLKEARDAKTDLRGILLDIPLFDAKEYEDLSIFTALMLQRKPTEFREFINNLNQRLELGTDNLFGESNSAQSVLEDYKQQNKLTDNERETIRLAEQARESATQSVSGGVQTDGINADTRGEGDNGDSVSEAEGSEVNTITIDANIVDADIEKMSPQEAFEYLNEQYGDDAKSFIEDKYRDAKSKLERAEKFVSMAKNRPNLSETEVNLVKKGKQDAQKKYDFWNNILKEYNDVHRETNEGDNQETAARGARADEATGQGDNRTSQEDGNRANDRGDRKEANTDILNSFDDAKTQEDLLQLGLDIRNAFSNINGDGNRYWRSWVDANNQIAYYLSFQLQKAQQEAEANKGVVSTETVESIISTLKHRVKTYDSVLTRASSGQKTDISLEYIKKDSFLGKNGIEPGVYYEFDTLVDLYKALSSKDDDIDALAKRVFSIAERLGLKIIFSNKGFKEAEEGVESGVYVSRNTIALNTNVLNKRTYTDSQKKATMLHETIHALTSYALNDNNTHKLTKRGQKAVKELKDIYRTLKRDKKFTEQYGSKNVKEMVAEMANPNFRAYLKAVNLFKKIVNALTEFFLGESRQKYNTTAFNEVQERLIILLDEFDERLYNEFNGLSGPVTNDIDIDSSAVGRPAGYSTNDLEMTAKDKFLHKTQDRMRPVTTLLREIEQRGGTMDEASDVHSQEFLSASRASAEMEDFNFNMLIPLVDSFAEAMKVFANKMGMVREDAEKAVYDYLYAKHAIERNKKICMDEMLDAAKKGIAPDKVKLMDADFIAELGKVAEQLYDNQFNGGTNLINPSPALTAEQNKLLIVLAGKMQKEADNISKHFETDASGKSVYIGNNRSGMNDTDAKALLTKLYTPDTKGALDDVSAKVKVCTDFTLDKWLEYGLISQAEYSEYKARYNNYIPLRGWEEKGDNTDYASILNSRKNSGGLLDLNREAKGRWSKADNPIAHIQSMAQSACITGNRNLIRQKAFNLVMQNEGIMKDLASFEYTYEVYDDYGNLDYTTPIKPEQSLFDEGKVKTIRDKSYEWHKTSAEIDTHVVSVFINGDRHNFVFKGTLGGQVATAVKGNENKTTGIIKQLLAKGTRDISANLTARNVYFLGKNLMRDLGFGNFAYFVENGKFINPKLYAGAMKTAAMDAMHADPSSIKDYDLYQEFKLNGGQTGYVQLKDIDNLKKDFDKLLKEATANDGFVVRNGKEMWDTLTMTFDVMGKASENAMRFAVYKMERQRGATPREAAIRAKEITVNFNRQGVDTKGWSAAYAFFNPAVQGAYRYAKLAKEHPGRFVIATAALMAMKFGLGVICEMFSGGDDEPDGESAYDRLSDYVKATNWVIPLSWMPGEGNDDKFLCIPLPQSVRASTHLSDCAVDILFGRKDFGEALKDAALFAAGEFLPFDIDAIDVEGKRFIPSLVQSAMPTIARPLYEAYVSNRDFMGNPISKEPFLRDQDYIPQSELAFGSTSPILVGTSKFLNKLAGGDDYRSAGLQITQNGQVVESALGNFMDVNPARLEHLFSGYFGGVFKPVVDTWTTMSSFVDEDVELTAQSAVLVNQFIKGPTSKPGYKTYYRMRDENDDIVNAVNIYKDKPEYSEDYKRLISNRYNHEVVEYYKTYSEIVKSLNESIALIKTNSASVEDHKEKIAELEAQRDALILEAATVYRDICKRRDNDN